MKTSVVVAAVQMPFAWAESPQEYFDRMNVLVAEAAQCGAELVVFPEHTGDMLVGMQAPGAPASFVEGEWPSGPFAAWSACVRHTSAATAQFLVHTFESLASRYHLFIVPGTICLPASQPDGLVRDSDPVYRAAFLFGPDGQVLAEQRQLHPRDTGLDKLAAGDSINAADTALGRLVMLIGEDTIDAEVRGMVTAGGIDLVIHVGAAHAVTEEPTAAALRLLVESARVFAVTAQLSGAGYAGLSAILAPAALTPSGDGVLARVRSADMGEVVCATFDWARMRN